MPLYRCTPDTFRIAQLKWSSGARPGSKVGTPIFETENVRKKNPHLSARPTYAGLPRMARIVTVGLSVLYVELYYSTVLRTFRYYIRT